MSTMIASSEEKNTTMLAAHAAETQKHNQNSNPKQLKFRIEYCSGEDPEYPSSELNTHSPQTKGWQTPPFCDFPQDLGLMFLDGPVQLSQLQILSHESKIATKIDVYVGEGHDYENCTFRRLGYLSLDSNERSDYAARELKSVYISARGRFLKLSIHKCHLNRHNMYNQAGIVAINVLGFSLPEGDDSGYMSNPSTKVSRSIHPGKSNGRVPPWEDLAFDMNFDPQTAKRIREVHEAKEKAVEEEEYELAKRLKNVENHLKAQGVQLTKLENDKLDAVKSEDYDRAHVIKQEILRIRSLIENQISEALPSQEHLFSHHKNSIRNPHAVQQPIRGAHDIGSIEEKIQVPPHMQYEQNPIHDSYPVGGDPLSQQMQQPIQSHPFQQIPHHNIPTEDDRPLPTLSNQNQNLQQRQREMGDNDDINYDADPNTESNADNIAPRMSPEEIAEALEGVEGVDELPEADEIPVAMATEASQLSEVLDEYVVRCLFSSHVRLRTAALNKIELDLNGSDRFDMSDVHTFSRVRLFGDVIEKVMESDKLNKTVVHENIEQFMQNIVDKLGDIGGRVREASYQILLQLANAEVVGVNFVSSYVLKPLRPGKTMLWRPLLARLKLVAQFVRTFKLQSAHGSGKINQHPNLNLKSVMGLITANNGHLHPNSNVRDVAKELTMEIYKIEGAAVIPYLKDFRRKQVEEYQASFAQIDNDLNRDHLYAGANFGNLPAEVARTNSNNVSPLHNSSSRKRDKNTSNGNVNININLQTSPTGSKVSLNHNDGQDYHFDDKFGVIEDEFDNADEPYTCQFCGRNDETFTEAKLDLHYWRECPMLTSCSKCDQVIEISTLNEHLLKECKMKDNHKECPRCAEAIAIKFFKMHVKRNTCLAKRPLTEANRCPLCHKNISSGERGWRKHLLTGTGCPKNDRTKSLREPK